MREGIWVLLVLVTTISLFISVSLLSQEFGAVKKHQVTLDVITGMFLTVGNAGGSSITEIASKT